MPNLLAGFPSMEEIDAHLAAQPDPLSGFPSMQEIDAHLGQETPLAEQQRLQGEYARARADEMIRQNPTGQSGLEMLPIVGPLLRRESPIARGLENMGAGVVQSAGAMLSPSTYQSVADLTHQLPGPIAGAELPARAVGGLLSQAGMGETSRTVEEYQRARQEEYRKRHGHDIPWGERIASGVVQGLGEIVGLGGTAGSTGYLTQMGVRAYDSGLHEAEDAGHKGADASRYAGINAAAEVLPEFLFMQAGRGAAAEALGLKKALKKTLLGALKTGGEEGAEEIISQFSQNVNKLANGIVPTDAEGKPLPWYSVLVDNLAESGAVGFLTGAAAGAPAAVGQLQRSQQTQPQQPEQPQPVEPPPTEPAPEQQPQPAPPVEQPVATPAAQQQLQAPEKPPESSKLTPESIGQHLGERGWTVAPDDKGRPRRFQIVHQSGRAVEIELLDSPIVPTEKQKKKIAHSYDLDENEVDALRVSGMFSTAGGVPLIRIWEGATTKTLDHELVHAAHRLGLFTPEEWNTLVQKYSSPERTESQQGEDIAQALQPTRRKETGAEQYHVLGRLGRFVADTLDLIGLTNSATKIRGKMDSPEFWARGTESEQHPIQPERTISEGQPQEQPRKPGIPGAQQALFQSEPQGRLFNVAGEPPAEKKAEKPPERTVSPLESAVPKQAEPLEGQKTIAEPEPPPEKKETREELLHRVAVEHGFHKENPEYEHLVRHVRDVAEYEADADQDDPVNTAIRDWLAAVPERNLHVAQAKKKGWDYARVTKKGKFLFPNFDQLVQELRDRDLVKGPDAEDQVWQRMQSIGARKTVSQLLSDEPWVRQRVSEYNEQLTAFDPSKFVESEGAFSQGAPQAEPVAETVKRKMEEIEPRARRGAFVLPEDLRQAMGMPKPEFDRLMMDLGAKGILSLHRHDYPGALTPEKRARLIHREAEGNQPGEFYSSVSIRRSGAYTTAHAPQAQPKPTKAARISQHDIRRTIEHIFGTQFLRNRVPKGAEGYYRWADQVARLAGRAWGNLGTITHELAHHLQQTADLDKAFDAVAMMELGQLDYDEERGDPTEGMAEFLRHYLTMDDAASIAPQSHAQFEAWLEKHPETAQKIGATRKLIDRFREQAPLDHVAANWWQSGRRAEVQDRKLREIVPEQFYTAIDYLKSWFYNDVHFTIKGLREALSRQVASGKQAPKLTPEELVEAFHRSDRPMAENAIFHGITSFGNMREDTPPKQLCDGLAQILKPISGEQWQEFWGYYDALDARERMERKPGYNPGPLESQVQEVLSQVETDPKKAEQYRDVAKGVRKFLSSLVDIQVESGVITPDAAKRIKESQEFYMPRYRTRELGLRGRLQQFRSDVGQKMFGVRPTTRRMSETGSDDPYLPPFDAIVKQTLQTYNACLHNLIKEAAIRAWDPQMGGAEGMGQWLTRVNPKNVFGQVRLERLIDDLTHEHTVGTDVRSAVVAKQDAELIKAVSRVRSGSYSEETLGKLCARYGVDPEAEDARRQVLGAASDVPDLQDFVSFWRQDFGEKPNEHIFRFVDRNGEVILYQVPWAPLYNELMGTGNVTQATIFSRVWAGVANTWNRAITTPAKLGSVALSVSYPLPASMMDYAALAMQSQEMGAVERFWKPWYTVGQLIGSKIRSSRGGPANPVAEVMDEFGGKVSSQRFGSPRSSVRAIEKEVRAKTTAQKAIAAGFDWLETTKDVISTPDTGMRMAECAARARSLGYTYKRLDNGEYRWVYPDGSEHAKVPTWVAIKMVNAGNEALTNFKRKGSVGRELDKLIMFFSAGMASSARMLKTVQSVAKREGAYKETLLAASVLAAASATYALLHHDDDDRKGLDPKIADRFWTFSAFGIPMLRLPKPRGYLWIPNMVEAVVDLAMNGKTDRIPSMLQTTFEDLKPPHRVAGASTALDLALNRDWANRQIELQSDRDRNIATVLRDTPYTLDTSRQLSKWLTSHVGIGPAQAEYVADQWTGGAYRDIVGSAEKAAKGKVDLYEAPVLRRFTFRSLHQRAINDFYEQYRDLQGDVNTAKELGKPDDIKAGQLRQMERYKDALTAIRKMMREKSSVGEKLQLERFSVGLSDYVLGRESRRSYPNPLAKTELALPAELVKVQQDFVSSLGHILTTRVNVQSRMVSRGPKQAVTDYVDHANEQRWAARELQRLGWSIADVEMAMRLKMAKTGRRFTDESQDALVRSFVAGLR